MIISLREKFLATKFGFLLNFYFSYAVKTYQQLLFSYFIHSNKKYIQLNKTSQSGDKIFSKLTEFVNGKTHKQVTISNHTIKLYSIRKDLNKSF